MKISKILTLVLALAMTTAMFAGCAGGDDKVLTMATNAEFPPFEFLEGEEIVGADVDMAKALAEKLGMTLVAVRGVLQRIRNKAKKHDFLTILCVAYPILDMLRTVLSEGRHC